MIDNLDNFIFAFFGTCAVVALVDGRSTRRPLFLPWLAALAMVCLLLPWRHWLAMSGDEMLSFGCALGGIAGAWLVTRLTHPASAR